MRWFGLITTALLILLAHGWALNRTAAYHSDTVDESTYLAGAVGLVWGLAMLAKHSALILPVPAVIALLWRIRSGWNWRRPWPNWRWPWC